MTKNGYPATDKFECEKCGNKLMYPNKVGKHIMGYECAKCKAVNYPIRSKWDAATQN